LRRRARAAVLAAALCAAISSGAERAGASGPGSTPIAGSSVVGGAPATIGQLPWLAFVQGEDSQGREFTCTGTVVAPRIVLTAGHCVEDTETSILDDPTSFSVTTGASKVGGEGAGSGDPRGSRVVRTLAYPGFDPRDVHGDAGVLVLAAPVDAPPLGLAGPADGPALAPRTPISIAGWGLKAASQALAPSRLQAATLVLRGEAYCKRRTRGYYRPYSRSKQLCAVSPAGHPASGCFGDSGGPAIARLADGAPVEVGIVSTGGPECSTSQPNVFTRVDLVSGWVGRWIAAVESGAEPPPVRLPRPRFPYLAPIFADFLAELALGEVFRARYRGGREQHVHCVSLARSKTRCAVSWRRGGNHYFGAMIVHFGVSGRRLVTRDRYTVHWARRACRERRGAAERRLAKERCPTRTRSGRFEDDRGR
jgi:secreted trypsin-like serine protease